jgi:ATP-dependent RNA helicase RhlE
VEKLIGKPIPRNGAVVPAVAETLEEPAPKPTRSRSRRKPAAQEPDVPAVAEVAEVAAAETEVAQPVETRAEKPVDQRPAKPERKVEAPRRERRNGRQGEVVGMGDHMPGFIAMSFDERRTD